MQPQLQWKRNAMLFLGSQTISLFGSSLVQYAIMWHVMLDSKSGMAMTLYIICGFLPTFFLSPFAGVWADRYNRKTLIMVSDSLIALSTLVLAILFLTGHGSLWLFFVVAAIRALGAAVQTPAVGAFIPQWVPQDKLMRVNGAYATIQSVVMLASPMLGAALLSVTSIEVIFFIDVVTAAIAVAILLLFLRVPAHEKASTEKTISYFGDMRAGITYIKNNQYIKTFFMFSAAFMVLIAPASFLTPLQVARSFGDDYLRLAAIEIVFSIGMMIGGALMASWGGFPNKTKTMVLAYAIVSVCTLALGIMPLFWLYLLAMGIFGIAIPIYNTPAMVMLQQKIDADYLGRVFGVFSMISSSMMPMGMLVFGPLADIVAIEWLLIGTGLCLLVQTVLMLYNRVLIEAGEPEVDAVE